MNNLTVFSAEYEGQSVRITPDGRVSVFDAIAAFRGTSCNPHQIWGDLQKNHPEVLALCHNFQFPGQGQRPTPIIAKEHLELILDSLPSISLVKRRGTISKTSNKFYPTTEAQVIAVIKAAFPDCQPISQFYVAGYRIDLYLSIHQIAVECDEYGHKNKQYCPKKEAKREQIITQLLNCSWVRFNPYSSDFNIGEVIYQIRQLVSNAPQLSK